MRTLRTFAAVAAAGSFAGHARDLGVDPSSVSRDVAALEAEVGVRLFERTTRRLSLTEAGRLYLDRIRPLLDELAAAREVALDAVEKPSGLLRISASVAFAERWLMPRIAGFRQAYPGIEIDMRVTDAVVDLAAEGVDLAVRLGPRIEGDAIVSKLFVVALKNVRRPHVEPAAVLPPCGHICPRLGAPHEVAEVAPYAEGSVWCYAARQTPGQDLSVWRRPRREIRRVPDRLPDFNSRRCRCGARVGCYCGRGKSTSKR